MTEQEKLAQAIRGALLNCWNAALHAPKPAPLYRRMTTPVIGDLATEITSIIGGRSALDAVGFIEGMGAEPKEGTVYYIRTLDGRRVRWANAMFVAAPEYTLEPLNDHHESEERHD